MQSCGSKNDVVRGHTQIRLHENELLNMGNCGRFLHEPDLAKGVREGLDGGMKTKA